MSFARTLLAILALAVTAVAAKEPPELLDLRKQFEAKPTEAARVRYITKLVRLRARILAAHRDGWQAIDNEIVAHPMPGTADRRLLIGDWASPRHEYRYREDGTWTMLPEYIDGEKTTHGTWRIEKNRYLDYESYDSTPAKYNIIILTKEYFIYDAYILKRGHTFP